MVDVNNWFEGKVVIVTGGSSGIGRAAATAFSAAGASVVIAARRIELSEAIVRELRAEGGEVTFVPTDVGNPEAVERLCEETEKRYGALHCAFNNAGVSGDGGKKIAHQTLEGWDSVIQTNLRGTWLCMKNEIPLMLKSGGGQIVNMASDVGLRGSNLGIAPYVASKHGVVGLTKSAALEYARENIRINAICPGLTATEMLDPAVKLGPGVLDAYVQSHVPLGRIAGADEIARTVLWLCSPSSSYVVGQAIAVDGGTTA